MVFLFGNPPCHNTSKNPDRVSDNAHRATLPWGVYTGKKGVKELLRTQVGPPHPTCKACTFWRMNLERGAQWEAGGGGELTYTLSSCEGALLAAGGRMIVT